MEEYHPYKLFEDAMNMYKSRAAEARSKSSGRVDRIGVVVFMDNHSRIVPDMRCDFLSFEDLLPHINRFHPSVRSARAAFDDKDAESVPFALALMDGGVIAAKLHVRKMRTS